MRIGNAEEQPTSKGGEKSGPPMNGGFSYPHADKRGPWHTCLKRLDGSRCEAKHDRLFGVRQSSFFSVTSATTAR